jgi:transposase
MLRPIDRTRRDSPLYLGSARTLRDFIDPKHLLLKIDANFDFASLVEFLQERYSPHLGRPAIHPEVLIRALLLSAIYNITSYRQLVERISENLAWRWFCHLALEDEVFDHSTITVFIERIGPSSFQELLARLNEHLLLLRLLSSRTYADSSLVEADARTERLAPTDLPPKEFKERARREEGSFVLPERSSEGKTTSIRFLRYQDEHGRLPLSPVDPDARWRKIGKRLPVLGYKENLIVDKSGFILARRVTPADASDTEGILPLLDRLPIKPRSLCADTGYRSLRLRFLLRRGGVQAYIPLHPRDESGDGPSLLNDAFSFHGDHLTCKAGKRLCIGRFPDDKDVIQFVAKITDCQGCQFKADCLSPREKRKHVAASRYHFEIGHARATNQTPRFTREMNRRKTAVEGVFAHLDHLAWDKPRLRGLGKVDVQGSIAALAHNILKALTKVRFFRAVAASAPTPSIRTPRPGSPHSIFARLFPVAIPVLPS